jgi:hypothetical protein
MRVPPPGAPDCFGQKGAQVRGGTAEADRAELHYVVDDRGETDAVQPCPLGQRVRALGGAVTLPIWSVGRSLSRFISCIDSSSGRPASVQKLANAENSASCWGGHLHRVRGQDI